MTGWERAPVRVLAAVIARGGRYLVGRRPAHKRHGGLWEFPGGKAADEESDLAAVRRELREELGLTALEVGRILHGAADPGSPYRVVFVEVEVANGAEPVPIEHEELRWATPSELSALELAPADADFVAAVLRTAGP